MGDIAGGQTGRHGEKELSMDGAGLIAAERRRQVKEEGWTPEHDDEHDQFEMSRAAACYLLSASTGEGIVDGEVPDRWPAGWHPSWWKPSVDPIRDLVRAGALIAAEIDRLTRSGGPS